MERQTSKCYYCGQSPAHPIRECPQCQSHEKTKALLMQAHSEIEQLKKALASSCDEERSLVISEGGRHAVCGLAAELTERAERAESEIRKLNKDINDLNNLLRAAGWGQGEIDSGACIEEKNEKLRTELNQQQIYIAALEGYADSYALSRARAAVEAAKGDIK